MRPRPMPLKCISIVCNSTAAKCNALPRVPVRYTPLRSFPRLQTGTCYLIAIPFATDTEVIRLSDHTTEFVAEPNSKLRDRVKAAKLPKSEFFRVDIGDGLELDAWRILPPILIPRKSIRSSFMSTVNPRANGRRQVGGDQILWHSLLAQMGYVVMSFDNRGTPAPRGRQWRKSIYRQIGILASADQAAAVKSVLKQFPYLDPERVGVWGWSGGGSMTLNALFRYPETYKAGVSIAPVPNQLYYDTIYQERYMGLPTDNAEGYRLGSPITFANQLKGSFF